MPSLRRNKEEYVIRGWLEKPVAVIYQGGILQPFLVLLHDEF